MTRRPLRRTPAITSPIPRPIPASVITNVLRLGKDVVFLVVIAVASVFAIAFATVSERDHGRPQQRKKTSGRREFWIDGFHKPI